ncbi:hypothetical protein LG634_25720 [Streptomyces bambusae]|uniref:hypothetical protein n=1 Tax=Streptomyces bambusae TaxID=1550616 RepID=UPI001CFE59F0|nr:hypothetical protein [Streptomyces bambusae]MCB5168216.1 hypothetical protein [Streptomyces bambusae]
MGIESDQLVYDYLSRVGDLAQRRQLSSGDRMRLVAALRDEIDRQRAKYEPETTASVRRILDRLGSPEELIEAAGGTAGSDEPAVPVVPVVSVPVQRGPRRFFKGAEPEAAAEPPPSTAARPPHLAGEDELGSDRGEPDWWRVEPSGFGADVGVPGFAGGIEIPELLKKPAVPAADAVVPGSVPGSGPAPEPVPVAEPVGRVRTVVRALRERRGASSAAAAESAPRQRPHVVLLLAAAVLVGGAVSGSWVVLAGGWLLAYVSKVLGPAEKKAVLFGVPGVVLGGAVVWLWGRSHGRWGDPLVSGRASEAFVDLWPLLVRVAAVSCAAYLALRSRRRA